VSSIGGIFQVYAGSITPKVGAFERLILINKYLSIRGY